MLAVLVYLFAFVVLVYLFWRLLLPSPTSQTSTKGLSLLTLARWYWKCRGSTAKSLLMIGKTAKVAEFKLVTIRSIVVSDVTIAKEMFQKSAFSYRPANTFLSFFGQDSGVALNSGQNWKEQRRFCHQHLKQLGFGTKSMEVLIQQEIKDLMNKWSSEKGQRFSPNKDFYLPVLSSLWVLLVGERVPTEDARLLSLMLGLFSGVRKLANLPELALLTLNLKLSSMKRVVRWIPLFPGITETQKFVSEYRSHFKPIINARKKILTDNETPTNLLDQYILKLRHTTDVNSYFFGTKGDNNVTQVILDFLLAGGDTTSHMLSWAMLHLIRNPTVQNKIQVEIDAVVGNERLPSLQDIPNCPYTFAFVLELLRFSPAAATGVPHSVMEDTQIGPYFFRKDTNIFFNIYGIHHDPLIWGDPENFRPERFLSADGKTVVKHEALCAFSVGLRRCVGEQVAYANLFLFISSICQRFKLRYDPLLKERPSLDDEKSALFVPKKFYMVATDRCVT